MADLDPGIDPEFHGGGDTTSAELHYEYQLEDTYDRRTETLVYTGTLADIKAKAAEFTPGETPEASDLDAGEGEEGPYVIASTISRGVGGLCTLRIRIVVLKKIVHWMVDFSEISKPILTWGQNLDDDAPNIPAIESWLRYKDNGDDASYAAYACDVEVAGVRVDNLADIGSGNTLKLAKMMREKGIDSYTIHAPVATGIITYMDYPPDVGTMLDKTAGTPISAEGYNEGREEILSQIKDLASRWLCTGDRAVQNSDGTYTRTIQWTGADSINEDLYDEADLGGGGDGGDGE